MSRKYKFHNKSGLYFVSFAIVNWIDVFTRQEYFNVLSDSINYCRVEKGIMKKLFYIFLLVSFCCCNKKQSNTSKIIKYYPSEDFFRSNDLVEIDLNNPKLKFKKITHRVNDLHIKDSTPYISLIKNDTIINIIPLRDDWGYRKESNMLRVGKDSISVMFNNYPLVDLYRVLKKYYENNGEDPSYAESAKRVFVEIEIDTNATGSEFEKVLQNVVSTFDKINKNHADSLKLRIGLSYFHQIPLPSFPPPVDN